MPETVTNWRTLNVETGERAALHEALADAFHQHAGGSLHVNEYHIVLDGKVYRYFLACSDAQSVFDAQTEVEVSWETPAGSALKSPMSDHQARVHLDICRDGDKFADAISRIEMDPAARQELITQIVAMQRLAMVLNTPGRGLSKSRLARF